MAQLKPTLTGDWYFSKFIPEEISILKMFLTLKAKDWSAKINEDRSAVYRQNPGAIRLVGASSWGVEPVKPIRTVDPDYDVEPRKKISDFSIWDCAAPAIVGLLICGSLLVNYGIIKLEITRELVSDWGPSLVLCCFGIAIPLAIYNEFAESQERRTERRVQTNSFWGMFQKTGFFLYHDRVLEELGFKRLVTGLGTKHQFSLFYLNASGNLLVELVLVGFGAGKSHFSLATVTNDGKFLETHSLVNPKREKRDINLRWQRRSANHECIIRALDEHDRLVEEFTRGGVVQEAQFTEERFERFLRWGAEKNAI